VSEKKSKIIENGGENENLKEMKIFRKCLNENL